MQSFCELQPRDYQREYNFHSTVAMKLSLEKFNQVKSYIQRKQKPNFKQIVIRATLLKNGLILREYDFIQRKMFDRKLAKDKVVFMRTMNQLREFFQGTYDPNAKMKISLMNKIKSVFRSK